MKQRRKIVLIAAYTGFLALFFTLCFALAKCGWGEGEIPNTRPGGVGHVVDLAGALKTNEEYAENQLVMLEKKYGIEALIVSIPALGDGKTIEEAAASIFSSWQIGTRTNGRGILLLFAVKEKNVKMEVSYELEDVFTDLFTGYVEDIQLRPYFAGGQIGVGLTAVMEELEKRANIKFDGGYTRETIAKLDTKYLSGGGGAKVDLSGAETEAVKNVSALYRAGKTPEEAWSKMISSWREKVKDPELGIYTNVGRLICRDYRNMPDARFEENFLLYGKKRYEVLKKGDYAVLFFGCRDGWDNAPFLFVRSGEGWQFDLVSQRRYIRMGPSPKWGVEWSEGPYTEILADCPSWTGQDMPRDHRDACDISRDKYIAARILKLERQVEEEATFATLLELGRLYAVCSMGIRAIPVLERAKDLAPGDPLPNRYIAVAHVDAFYQYEKAKKEIQEYIRKRPKDPYGHNFLGFIFMATRQYEKAVEKFRTSISQQPHNSYACTKLSEAYLRLALLKKDDKNMWSRYRGEALKYFTLARNFSTPDSKRITRLETELAKRGLLKRKDR